jgi:hypothetical protein
MIENVKEKLKNGQLGFEFAESGNIIIIERRFTEDKGVPIMKPTQEVSSAQIQDLIADHEGKIMVPARQKAADLAELLKAVIGKEAERAKLEEKAKK